MESQKSLGLMFTFQRSANRLYSVYTHGSQRAAVYMSFKIGGEVVESWSQWNCTQQDNKGKGDAARDSRTV